MSNPSSAVSHPTFTLWAQGQQVALSEGVSLERAQFPMLVPANPGGPVALVNVNPHDPMQLGLRNLTTSPWTATLPDGSSKEIGTDKSVRLSAGTVIQAGPLQWEIREQPAPVAAPAPAHFAPSPQAAAGFVAASEPAIQPQPVVQAHAGFVQASTPAAPPPAPMGFVQAPPPPAVGFVQAGPPPAGMGFVQDNGPAMPGQPPPRPGGAARNIITSSSLSFSQIFPVMGERKELLGKGFLIPGATTALVAALLFNRIDHGDYIHYIYILAAYIGLALLFAIYQVCGKHKPFWIVAVPVVFTFFYLKSGLFFVSYKAFDVLGAPDDANDNPLMLFFHYIFSVGIREEFTKALPVLLLFFFARKLASPLREKIGVLEPLDGVLLGAAAGLGFTMFETLTDYVPKIINEVMQKSGSEGTGALFGLMLMIPRVLNMISGHIAWAGYFGYFIGLAAIRPKHTVKLLLIGWLTAAALHGTWDASATLLDRDHASDNVSVAVTLVEGIVAYAFLIAAVLKARQLSPDRAHNFATQIKGV